VANAAWVIRPLVPLVVVAIALALMASAPASAATLGQRTLGRGDRGPDVATLQRVLAMKGYAVGPADGVFGRVTKLAVRQFQKRAGLAADGRVGPLTTHALAYAWAIRTATFYGPGLWGNRTACGFTLARRTLGIAHRTLPCGRAVPVYYGGRLAIFRVIDRGPYTSGVALDLTAAAAGMLGMSATSAVRAGY
jgi:peptidoglycan hydrolase-like protein with peptidoglycan-binding domain